MSSLINLLDISVINAEEQKQMCMLAIDAIDNLEQIARARDLTSIIWDINTNGDKTEQDWRKIEILLQSYEKTRDESLESALSDLKELITMMNNSNLNYPSHNL
ncbi:MAG: hypothetical protein AAGE96_11125 [Cyanobacteria bacterium P01_G01_bin.19]